VSDALRKALEDGVEAIKNHINAVEVELEKQKVDAGSAIIDMCSQSVEDYMQSIDLIEGFLKRHARPE
jgi:hypothetical protein